MSPTGTQPDAQPQAQPAGQPPAQPDAATLQREIETLKSQVEENRRAAEYWHGEFSARQAPPPAKPPEAEDVDLLDLITSKGPKGLDEHLAKRGYISREEVHNMIQAGAKELMTEQELMREYPDLAPDKRNSEFFRATADEYGRLVKDGVPPHIATNLAARNTELAFLKSGKIKTSQQQADEKKAQREADRQARINAQSGDRNMRAAEPEEGDQEITAIEDRIIKGMLQGMTDENGKPMTYEQATERYKKRANSGSIQVTPRSRK